MQLTLKVDTGEGPYEVTTDLWVITLWERKYKRQAPSIPKDGISLEGLMFMGYEASKVAGITVPAVFDDFIKRLVIFQVVEDDPANPTQAEPTAIP